MNVSFEFFRFAYLSRFFGFLHEFFDSTELHVENVLRLVYSDRYIGFGNYLPPGIIYFPLFGGVLECSDEWVFLGTVNRFLDVCFGIFARFGVGIFFGSFERFAYLDRSGYDFFFGRVFRRLDDAFFSFAVLESDCSRSRIPFDFLFVSLFHEGISEGFDFVAIRSEGSGVQDFLKIVFPRTTEYVSEVRDESADLVLLVGIIDLSEYLGFGSFVIICIDHIVVSSRIDVLPACSLEFGNVLTLLSECRDVGRLDVELLDLFYRFGESVVECVASFNVFIFKSSSIAYSFVLFAVACLLFPEVFYL